MCIRPRQAAALLLLLRMPAGDDVELTRRAVLRGSLKVRSPCYCSQWVSNLTAHRRTT